MLLLSDLATGLQELRLKASLPVNQGYIVPLPYVRFEEAAEVVDSAWELFREPDVDVDLLLAPGIPLVESARESSIQDRPLLVTRYHTFDPDPKSSIRVSSRHAPCLSRTAIVLSQQSDRVWRMTGRFWLTPLGQSPRRLGMHFPAKFTDPSRVSVENANGTWQEPVEGWRPLDLALSPDPAEVTVSFEMVIEEPTNGPWELPWPIALQASSDERCLIIVPSQERDRLSARICWGSTPASIDYHGNDRRSRDPFVEPSAVAHIGRRTTWVKSMFSVSRPRIHRIQHPSKSAIAGALPEWPTVGCSLDDTRSDSYFLRRRRAGVRPAVDLGTAGTSIQSDFQSRT